MMKMIPIAATKMTLVRQLESVVSRMNELHNQIMAVGVNCLSMGGSDGINVARFREIEEQWEHAKELHRIAELAGPQGRNWTSPERWKAWAATYPMGLSLVHGCGGGRLMWSTELAKAMATRGTLAPLKSLEAVKEHLLRRLSPKVYKVMRLWEQQGALASQRDFLRYQIRKLDS